MVAYPDGVGASVRSTPKMLELVLVPPSVEMVTRFVLVVVPAKGIRLVRSLERGIGCVLNVEGNEPINKTCL